MIKTDHSIEYNNLTESNLSRSFLDMVEINRHLNMLNKRSEIDHLSTIYFYSKISINSIILISNLSLPLLSTLVETQSVHWVSFYHILFQLLHKLNYLEHVLPCYSFSIIPVFYTLGLEFDKHKYRSFVFQSQ